MKRFSVLLAAASLLAAIAGCQKEPVGNENVESAKAYAQLNISFATGNTKAETVDGTDVKDAGTKPEYEVKSATLYFVASAGSTITKIETLNGNFTEQVVGNDVYYTHVVEELAPGTYRIYVTVNYALDGIAEGDAEEELQNSIQTSTGLLGASVPANGMPMSSRDPLAAHGATAEDAGLYTEATITSGNTKDNPCHISLDIERTLAKVSYEVVETDNVYSVFADRQTSGTQIATIALKQFSVLNQTKAWHAFRRVCTYDGTTVTPDGYGLISDAYLYDPNIGYKNSASADNADTYLFDGTVTDITATAAGNTQILAYTYENALHKDKQLAGYVTTIRFVGKITPVTANLWYFDGGVLKNDVAYVANDDLYYYDNEFYTSIEALNAKTSLGVNASNFRDFNVKFYEDGTCYYDYYIKHFDNGKNPTTIPTPDASLLLGVMEYAIVRNNSYVVSVSDILAPGNDEVTDVDPSTPVEQTQTYFQVKLTIRPWVVRAQDAVLG